MKWTFLFFLMAFIGLKASDAQAFRFSSPEEGRIVVAGSTLKVKIDPGDLSPLFGVLLSANRGIIKAHLDSSMPYEWTLEIPIAYHGPLTLWATVRRYIPVPNPPQTSVTFYVVFPLLLLEDRPGQEKPVPLKMAPPPQAVPPARGGIAQDPPAFPRPPALHWSR